MRGQRGSFLGFTFNDIHSSVFGITRTSDGTRSNQNLAPMRTDETMEVPGADGAIYIGSTFEKAEFTINYAFDGVTEDQLQSMKMIWNDKKIHDFIYDECPYKVYSAKLTGTSQIKHLAFVEDGQRLYKGEGSLTFTCYFPYARSRFEYIEDYHEGNIPEWLPDDEFWQLQLKLLEKRYNKEIAYKMSGYIQYELDNYNKEIPNEEYGKLELVNGITDETSESYGGLISLNYKTDYNNLEEWKEASRIPSRTKCGQLENGIVELFNAGDIVTNTIFYYEFTDESIQKNLYKIWFVFWDEKDLFKEMKIEIPLEKRFENDKYLLIDSRNNLIEGCDENMKPTGHIYNSFCEGEFFYPPLENCYFLVDTGKLVKFEMKYYYI